MTNKYLEKIAAGYEFQEKLTAPQKLVGTMSMTAVGEVGRRVGHLVGEKFKSPTAKLISTIGGGAAGGYAGLALADHAFFPREKRASTALLRNLAKRGVGMNSVGSHGWTAYDKASKISESAGLKAMGKAEARPAAAEMNRSLGLRSNVEEVHKALKQRSPLSLHQEYMPGHSFPDGKTFIKAKVRE